MELYNSSISWLRGFCQWKGVAGAVLVHLQVASGTQCQEVVLSSNGVSWLRGFC
jgi:hypothetical protein